MKLTELDRIYSVRTLEGVTHLAYIRNNVAWSFCNDLEPEPLQVFINTYEYDGRCWGFTRKPEANELVNSHKWGNTEEARMKRVPIEIDGREAYIESIAWRMTYLEPDKLDVRITLREAVGVYDCIGFEVDIPVNVYTTREEVLNAVRVVAGVRLRAILDEDQADLARRQTDKPVVLTRLVDEIKVLIGLD